MSRWKERKWQKIKVEAIAQGDEITVFLHSKCDFPADINASHWDDFKIEAGDTVPPSEEPPVEEVPVGFPTLEQIEEVVRRVVQEELAKLND
jgi:hypothetical protein